MSGFKTIYRKIKNSFCNLFKGHNNKMAEEEKQADTGAEAPKTEGAEGTNAPAGEGAGEEKKEEGTAETGAKSDEEESKSETAPIETVEVLNAGGNVVKTFTAEDGEDFAKQAEKMVAENTGYAIKTK